MHRFDYVFYDILRDVERLEESLQELKESGRSYRTHWIYKKLMLFESIDEICSIWYGIELVDNDYQWIFDKVLQTPTGISFMYGAGIDPYYC